MLQFPIGSWVVDASDLPNNIKVFINAEYVVIASIDIELVKYMSNAKAVVVRQPQNCGSSIAS